jgi:hypothetical protein
VKALLERAQRPLVLWDAHGFEIAEWVLGKLLPALVSKPHLVLMHDMSDTRFEVPSAEYGETEIWKGTNAGDLSVGPASEKISRNGETGVWQRTNAGDPALWLGHLFSKVSQAISIVDFASRNRLPLHSGAESLHAEIASDPARMASLRELLGDDLFSLQAHWYWFTLNEAPGALYFPPYRLSERAVTQRDAEYQARGHQMQSELISLEQVGTTGLSKEDVGLLTKALQDKQQIEKLWREVEHSAGWRMLNGWRVVRNRALPENTWRRKLYDSALGTLRSHSRTRSHDFD